MKNVLFDINGRAPGGFPLRGETIKFVQDSWLEIIAAIGGDIPANTPVVMSGMVASVAGGNTTISPGWFYLNGNVYPCAGGTIATPTGGNVVGISLNSVIVQDDFKNLPAPVDVYLSVSCSVISAAASPTVLNYATFRIWQEYFAARGAGAWQVMTITATAIASGATVSGTLNWRKNLHTQRLEVFGSLTVSNAQLINLANYYSIMCTFPGAVVAGQMAYTAQYRYHNATMVDFANTNVMYSLNGDMFPDGSGNTVMTLGWIRPATITSYTVSINTSMPLA